MTTIRVTTDTPAAARPMTESQRRWIEALAAHHGVEPDQIPDLTASQAGQLIGRHAGTLPREIRQELGPQ